MNIVSYRGPCSPGGVSGTLSNVFNKYVDINKTWWHLSGTRVLARKVQREPEFVCNIPEGIVDGHYRFCNNALWPILHDMPDYAILDEAQNQSYRLFNQAFAWNVKRTGSKLIPGGYFVQDYQLALVPSFLRMISITQLSVFWHVPWPQKVREMHIPILKEIAEGLLSAQQIGFHTVEYADNFLEFVQNFLPTYIVDRTKRSIQSVSTILPWGNVTQIVSQPLGIDFAFWTKQRNLPSPQHGMETMERFVLSVDRADYTKGVLERFAAIDQFLLTNPQWRDRVSFVQVCQRTRAGLPQFDQYWNECVERAESINHRWSNNSWKPIVWIQDSLSPTILSKLYHQSAACLVTPLRDGLNLTAKEFVACSDDRSGVLMLSPNAGAWHELGDHALSVIPSSKEQMASQISAALEMSSQMRKIQSHLLREKVKANSLHSWWQQFNGNEGKTASSFASKVENRRRQLHEHSLEASVLTK